MPTSHLAYLALVLAVGLERLFELWLSKRNARAAFAAGGREVGQGHFRVMSAFHTAFLLACVGELVWRRPGFPGVVGWVALAGVVAAHGLRYWAVATLGERWNVRVIVWPGRPPVTAGPYRFV